jgi:hypothetical protein
MLKPSMEAICMSGMTEVLAKPDAYLPIMVQHAHADAMLVLQILSTYVQVLALLPLVPMGWGGAARWLFRSLGEVSGISIGLGNFLDCALSPLSGWSHSTPAARTIFAIFVPGGCPLWLLCMFTRLLAAAAHLAGCCMSERTAECSYCQAVLAAMLLCRHARN